MEDFEQKMRDIAQEVHDENSTSDQFAVSQAPFHTHNGLDSQRIPFIGLSDVPTSYWIDTTTNSAGKSVIVNSSAQGLEFSSGSLPLTATDGFITIPYCAGTPTGTPSAGIGAMILDITAKKLWIWTGAAWQYSSLT